MATLNNKVKKKGSENRFRRAPLSLREMTAEERIPMLVEAGLMGQAEADRAKDRHRQG